LTSGIAAVAASCISYCASAGEMPRYEHIFVIVAENKSFDQIIGRQEAPRLNSLAKEYGLATQFYAETHPSEGNYVAILGGNTFGIRDDDAWYCKPSTIDAYCPHSMLPGYVPHSASQRSLMDQLADANLTWKGYFEDLPAPGSLAIFSPSSQHPDAERPAELYAAKHNGFVNFERVDNNPEFARNMVPLGDLAKDLAANTVPNYAQIILNQCNDMHGLHPSGPANPPADCIVERGKPETFAALIRRGDAAIGAIVDAIMAAPLWTAAGNAAIVITWDEDNWNTAGPQGCCGYDPKSAGNPGGGHIATIVITNHGPRHVEDSEAYNHYSLLRTTEEAFGISEYLGFAGEAGKGIKAMTPLFDVTRSSTKASE
jgi:hypothetical protein